MAEQERRMRERFTKRGGKGFWVLRSAETGMRRYQRPAPVSRQTETTEG